MLNEPLRLIDFYPSLKIFDETLKIISNSEGNDKIVENTKKLNFICGPNNSGKSQIARIILRNIGKYQLKEGGVASEFVREIELKIRSELDPGVSYYMKREHESSQSIFDFIWNSIFHSILDGPQKSKYFSIIADLFKRTGNSNDRVYLNETQFSFETIKNDFESYANDIQLYINNISKFYVPTDRNLFSQYNRENFDKQLRESFFSNNDDGVVVFSGSKMYEEILHLRTTSSQSNKELLAFEEFLGRSFFDGQDVFFSPVPKDKNQSEDLYIKIGSEPDRPFYQLGEGIQSLIIITYLSRFKDKAFIAIEEPENNLHPGLQRKLVEVLLDEGSKDNMILATTHSNHFLEFINDPVYKDLISFFSVIKEVGSEETKHKISRVDTATVDLLDALGVNNRSVLLANCIIWVEGISDVWYLRRYLEVFKKDLPGDLKDFQLMNEGLHFAFAFSGGNLLHHFDFSHNLEIAGEAGVFARQLANKFMVITDGGKKELFAELKDVLGENYLKLGVLEIENTLSPRVVEKVIRMYPSHKDSRLHPVQEDQNWKGNGMGYLVDVSILKRSFKSDPGKKRFSSGAPKKTATLTNKTDFASKAISCIESPDDLSTYTRETLLPRIIRFILEANGRPFPIGS